MNKLDAIYRPGGRVVVRTIGDEILLVPVSGAAAGACVYPINSSALVVWTCLSSGGTVRQAAELLTEQFAVSMQEALEDSECCAKAFVADSLLKERCL